MSLRHPVITRFAPTPSGELHVGHVLAAWQARRLADLHGGRCMLRIEDIDTQRTRNPQWIAGIYEDLKWLGIHFDGDVMVQSRRMEVYAAALEKLRNLGLLYPCFCTRAEIRAEWDSVARAPHTGEHRRYSGRCRNLPTDRVAELLQRGVPHAWRINMRRVEDIIGCPQWEDLRLGVRRCVPSACEDAILARKDTPTSYHLAVVVDDAAQLVNVVTRGADLLEFTPLQRALQAVLGLPAPIYAHHLLLRGKEGRRLTKRDGSCSVRSLRQRGVTPRELLAALKRAVELGGIWGDQPL